MCACCTRAGTENELGGIAQGVLAVADAHRHGAENEKENHVGKTADQLGERHRPAGEEPVHIRVSRRVGYPRTEHVSIIL